MEMTNAPSHHRTIELREGRENGIRGLYAIVDSGFCPRGDLSALAQRYLEGGCRLLQLRMKDAVASHREEVARSILKLKSRHDFTFILNDDVDAALAIGADGVHVGEHDEPVEQIRRRIGDRLLIGYSSHSAEEALRAEQAGADYVAFGAIFPTKTKGPGHPVQGVARLAELAGRVRVPLVAIGGITRANVREVLAAGVSSVAMITALALAPDVVAETRWFVDALASQTRDL